MNGVFILIAGVCLAAVVLYFSSYGEIEAHSRCVDARRIEQVVGKAPRVCAPLNWYREPFGHSPADHGAKVIA